MACRPRTFYLQLTRYAVYCCVCIFKCLQKCLILNHTRKIRDARCMMYLLYQQSSETPHRNFSGKKNQISRLSFDWKQPVTLEPPLTSVPLKVILFSFLGPALWRWFSPLDGSLDAWDIMYSLPWRLVLYHDIEKINTGVGGEYPP